MYYHLDIISMLYTVHSNSENFKKEDDSSTLGSNRMVYKRHFNARQQGDNMAILFWRQRFRPSMHPKPPSRCFHILPIWRLFVGEQKYLFSVDCMQKWKRKKNDLELMWTGLKLVLQWD